MHEVLKQRRAELGLSQAELAAMAGVDKRQIRRYEAGEQQPLLSVALAIANALQISVGELAGVPTHAVNLSGDWWSSWQTFRDGEERIALQEVQFRQQAELIQMQAISHGLKADEGGGYLWRGELRLWNNDVLMGWYAATNEATRSKGVLFFALNGKGSAMRGRWLGESFDGKIVSGWGGMARTGEEATEIIEQLKAESDG
ncbi:helix-turn-helix transcriptional regulator [Fodinicola acaciae]|uniref:helix-turn-helix transcriptional regulator n=1 Tax=Fodinicola acaciae TaxID=2681555 RepID=UPI0013D0F416|nr:helix-turn-helix transcriptional regulator [Fodinicola acaciae]